MPSAVYFAGGTVLYAAEDPQAVVESIKGEASGWAADTGEDRHPL